MSGTEDKPKVAFYWCASCGGCEEAVVDLAEAILDVVAAVEGVRAAGIGSVNLDLLTDIPGQTLDSWRATLRAVLDLAPEHVSVYTLTLDDPDAEGLTGPEGDHLPVPRGARAWRERAAGEQSEERAARMELLTDELAVTIASVLPDGAVTDELRPVRPALPERPGKARRWLTVLAEHDTHKASAGLRWGPFPLPVVPVCFGLDTVLLDLKKISGGGHLEFGL